MSGSTANSTDAPDVPNTGGSAGSTSVGPAGQVFHHLGTPVSTAPPVKEETPAQRNRRLERKAYRVAIQASKQPIPEKQTEAQYQDELQAMLKASIMYKVHPGRYEEGKAFCGVGRGL